MMNILKASALLLVLTFTALNVQAQEFGYVNSQLILSEMPRVKQAESNLEALQSQLQKKLQSSVETLQSDYVALQQKVERGELSRVQQEEQAQALQVRQQQLAQEEAGMVQQIQEKREELLQPIYDDLNTAIKAVAEEKGYSFILDQQVLLYGVEALDVSAAVRTKLGF